MPVLDVPKYPVIDRAPNLITTGEMQSSLSQMLTPGISQALQDL